MTKELFHIAIENILLIKNAPNESLHKNEFIHNSNSGIKLEDLIHFLVENDFIEMDRNDDIYFLTTETYHLLDSETLYSTLAYKLDHTEIDDTTSLETTPPLPEEELEKRQQDYIKSEKEQKLTNYLLISIGILLVTWLSYYNMIEQKKQPHTPIELNQKIWTEFKSNLKNLSDSTKIKKTMN